jgi:hypothetical protein
VDGKCKVVETVIPSYNMTKGVAINALKDVYGEVRYSSIEEKC